MSEDQETLAKSLAQKAQGSIPKGREIVALAMGQVLQRHNFNGDVSWLKSNFSMLIEEVQAHAYNLYLKAEAPASAMAFKEILGPLLPAKPTADDFFRMLGDNFTAIDRFFLSLTQGRRPRAGGAFEQVIGTLFTQLSYPYTPQAKIEGQPDFLLPHVDRFKQLASDCIIFTAKRTLRERWRQIVTEGSKGLGFFLATIDEDVKKTDLEAMKVLRVHLVVPIRVKETVYANVPNVLSFEAFFQDHLDPAMVRWKNNKIIS